MAIASLPLHRALAQDAVAVTDLASATNDMTMLETIVVTADRREESIKDVPVSVSTIGGENLDVLTSGGQDVRMLAARLPSLNIESSFGRAFPRFYIRGYGNTDFRSNASQPVSLIYDDVVQENPILKGFPIFDLEQVEVLRGPQGTLFGRNTPAGVIKFDSVKPTIGSSSGYVSVSEATYNTANFEGAVNLPLGERWAARLSLLYQHRDNWVDNGYTGEKDALEGYDDRAARFQLLFSPDENFQALVNTHVRDLDGTARLFRANAFDAGSNELGANFDRNTVYQDGTNAQTLKNLGGSLRLRWTLGSIAVHSITGYETLDTSSRGDIDGGYGAVFAPPSGPGFIAFPSETEDTIPNLDQFTQEFRLESDYSGPLNWQAGLFYFGEKYSIESFSYDSLAGGVQNAYERVRQTNDAYAAFGALNYAATPALKLRAGLRYTRDEKKFKVEDYSSQVFGTPATLEDLAAGGPLSASPSDSKTSWDTSASYALNPDVNLYARIANGFRAASIQGAGQFNNQSVAAPETDTSYEAGVKAELFERRLRLGFDAFHYTVKDQQLTAVGGDANSNILLNAEKTVGQGVELDLEAILADDLLMTLGASYNATEIQDPGLAGSFCAACTLTDPLDANGKAVIDGNPLPQAPKYIASFTLRYGIPTAAGEWFAYTDWSYRSEVNFFLYESKEFTGKPLLEGGLRLGYNWANNHYEIAAFGRNITDEEVAVGGIDFNNLTGFINEPRLFGVQFKARY